MNINQPDVSRLQKVSEAFSEIGEKLDAYLELPKVIGASATTETVNQPKKIGGKVLNGLVSVFCGGSKLLNKGLDYLAMAISFYPAIVVGVFFGAAGGAGGAMLALITGKDPSKSAKEFAMASFMLGTGITMAVIDIPFFITKCVVGNTMADIGLGFAMLGGVSRNEVLGWKGEFEQSSYRCERMIYKFIVERSI